MYKTFIRHIHSKAQQISTPATQRGGLTCDPSPLMSQHILVLLISHFVLPRETDLEWWSEKESECSLASRSLHARCTAALGSHFDAPTACANDRGGCTDDVASTRQAEAAPSDSRVQHHIECSLASRKCCRRCKAAFRGAAARDNEA